MIEETKATVDWINVFIIIIIMILIIIKVFF